MKYLIPALFVALFWGCPESALAKPRAVSDAPYYELRNIGQQSLIAEIQAMPQDLKLQALCLAMAVYKEARGESAKDQKIVAQLSVHRVGQPAFAPTLCGVIYQIDNFRGRRVVQYSWTVTRNRHVIKELDSWQRSQLVAYKALTENEPLICQSLYFSHCRMMSGRMRDVSHKS